MATKYNQTILPTPPNYAPKNQIDALNKYSEYLLSGGGQQPVHHWAQGLSNLSNAFAGGYNLEKTGNRYVGSKQFDTETSLPSPTGESTGSSSTLSGQLSYADMPAEHVAAIKGLEGHDGVSKWDVKQYTYGYGSRAPGPGIKIDPQTSEQLLDKDLKGAAAVVDRVNPNLTPGTRSALISLTHNTGDNWVTGSLGRAIAAGDEEGAKRHFLQYTRVAGHHHPVIAARRVQEAGWFGQGAKTSEDTKTPESALAFSGEPVPYTEGQSGDKVGNTIADAMAAARGGGAPVGGGAAGPKLPGAVGMESPGQVDPRTLPHRIPVSRDQIIRGISSDYIDPAVKSMMLEQYYLQHQPMEAKGPYGSTIVVPGQGGPLRVLPPPLKEDTIHGVDGTQAPETSETVATPQGPVKRVIPRIYPGATPGPRSEATPPPGGITPPEPPVGASPASADVPGNMAQAEAKQEPVKVAALGEWVPSETPPPVRGIMGASPPGTPEGGVKVAGGPQYTPPPAPSTGLPSTGNPTLDRLNASGLAYKERQKELEVQATENQKWKEKIEESGRVAAEAQSIIPIARAALENPNFKAGSLAEGKLAIQKGIGTFWPGANPAISAPGEILRKNIADLNLGDLKLKLGGLGQVRVFEGALVNQSNFNINNSKPAIRFLLEAKERITKRDAYIAQAAAKYGATDQRFRDWTQQIYNKNLFTQDELQQHLAEIEKDPEFKWGGEKGGKKPLDLIQEKPPDMPQDVWNEILKRREEAGKPQPYHK